MERAALMAQGGEFAFVLYAAATGAGIIDGTTHAILTATIILSMAVTPLMVIAFDRLGPRPCENAGFTDTGRKRAVASRIEAAALRPGWPRSAV
jgi:Kef-type K+ transport system membrane component KefB